MLTLVITCALSCKMLLVSTSTLLLSSKPKFLTAVKGMHEADVQFPKLHCTENCRGQYTRLKASLQNV